MLNLDTLALAMAMVLEATMVVTEDTTSARGRLRLSLDTLDLAMAMVLEATMVVTEATTLARGRLRLSLDTLALVMGMATVLAMLATEVTTSASKLLQSSAAILDQNKIVQRKSPSTFINVPMFLYFQNLNRCFRFPNQ